MSFRIGGINVGGDSKLFVVAELSGNHNQSLDIEHWLLLRLQQNLELMC